MSNTEREEVLSKARAAKAVAPQFAQLPTPRKNEILNRAAENLIAHTEDILAANQLDIEAGRANGMSESLIDRLSLDVARIEGIADGLRQVASLQDPVGEILQGRTMDNGIQMKQVRVPLGVMGMVYEARPNVTVDAFGLALKSGNVPLLRGSKSAKNSNAKLVELLQDTLVEFDLPREGVQLLPCETHDSVQDLITARGLVDLVIPRGGARLINAVVENATVPAIETGTGNCHFYVDASADLDKAIDMVINGKTRRPSVCNSTECVLIDAALDDASKLRIITSLQEAGVTIHGDVKELEAFGVKDAVEATDEEWCEEFLSMDICAKVVDGVNGAIAHIAEYTTGHTEAIAAQDADVLLTFANEVDAAAVMLNASTAFTDGEVYGMGAEIGISTQKLHARGPMALPELTSTKWVLQGTGQTRP
ncbi:gamma-glutamyl-phosphate reductase [Corynebacterium sp. HMSC062E11]|uniref:glutamate-5-semialdehyde dehydrogenase n=1 Tax=unclassified Corynebacterium TaxID=2624378 RepID=UPI0008A566A4|nr:MULTISPECIES: glutamate-5-semialdehyde dehydrogenase [unclassified Corynebacterium]MDK6807070.1 glutamate-5-semialdehyde dehydrogenase [Corynebacterium aurimucosum]NJJ82909.1 glutamate-5-semialdehyde dehydrogenase [Corynebacterium aurimucosum]OFK30336.1 gamma-glutamyl-phosphate reductase [Corynebacterium sp. HMSC062E11]OFP73546.1 gamma-glutamyl-phosphate reductase [Corynebacterium sp. HMSC078C09]